MFNLFGKKDPICGMKEEKDKGISKYDKWFCSSNCLKQYEEQIRKNSKTNKKGCCH